MRGYFTVACPTSRIISEASPVGSLAIRTTHEQVVHHGRCGHIAGTRAKLMSGSYCTVWPKDLLPFKARLTCSSLSLTME